MFVVIVGGGRTGSHLARMLHGEGHDIRVVDDRPAVVERIRQEVFKDAAVLGDVSSPSVLEAAGIQRAQVLAAVTADDEANLVVTSLGRFEFKVPRTIARVNNPENAWMFTSDMGVDVALNQADIMGRMIAEEMSLGDMMTLLKLRRGRYALVEEKIPPNAKVIGQAIKDIRFPDQCVIAAIIRHGEIVVPRGLTTFEAGDEVLAVTDRAGTVQLAELFRPVR